MQCFGRIAKLRLTATAEYDRAHAAVWPEVRAAITDAGIANYTIFRHGEWLFSYFELPAGVTLDKVAAVFEQSPACRRWEDQMHALRELDWQPMAEVFHQ